MSARGGLAQHQRMPAALAPHYFDVDELSLPQLLALTLDYAQQVRFADAGDARAAGTVDGDGVSNIGQPLRDVIKTATWRPYFSSDETLVIADILAFRADLTRAEFDSKLAHVLAGQAVPGQPVAREQLTTYDLYRMVCQLDQWSAVLLRHGSAIGIDLGALIVGLRQKMSPKLETIVGFYVGAEPWDAQVDLQQLITAMAAELGFDGPGAAHGESLRAHLRSWFNQLLKAIDMTQRAAADRLQASLHSGRHDPGVGLLLAFAQLYRAAQEKLNRFTARHRDFYYGAVLGMRPNGPVRDATFLVFQPVAAGDAVKVAAGTEFLAPYHRSAPPLTFRSEHTLVVTDARVAAAHTLLVERNPLSAPEKDLVEMRHQWPQQYPTGCYLHPLPVLAPEAALETARLTAAPLFGAPRAEAPVPPGKAARIGFALASNVLLLREGTRLVEVVLELGRAESHQGTDTGATLAARLAALPALMNAPLGEVQYKVLRQLFRLSVTGSNGWIAVRDYRAEFVAAGTAGQVHDLLQLSFYLGDEQAAVVPYRAALHGEQYDTGCPLLRCELDTQGYLYPYGLLRGLPLMKARIEVDVTGLRAIELHNNIGMLSAAAPFQPFGPLPAAGSYLIVGSAETACKRLGSLDLVLDWGGLPRLAGGLDAYYGGYVADGAPPLYQPVQVGLSLLLDGRWQVADGGREVPLLAGAYGGRRQGVPVREEVSLQPLLRAARPAPRATDAMPFAYTPSSKNGYFKLTLTGPDFIFGHRDYPFLLADALTYNSQPRHRRSLRTLPNPPYTPVLDALSINYRAGAEIVPGQPGGADGEALFRLSPNGWEKGRAAGDGGNLLLPDIDFSGNLYLGVAATDLRAPLTLYFHLLEDALPAPASTGATVPAERRLHWSYLAHNRWLPLPPQAVRADSTHAFLTPGVVTLLLPPDINRANTIMPSQLYWLRVSCETELDKFCSVYSVHAHAALVSRVLDDAAAPAASAIPAVIAAATIERSRQTIPGLGRITQMVASTGGRLPESAEQMRRRSAERLKHKGRAITADDYERLTLERFPAIDRVKCFPNLSRTVAPGGGACPGHVLIVGLPPYRTQGHVAVLPRLNGYLVGEVRAFLATVASPAVTIDVINPAYQRIQVRCKVKLRGGVDQGWYINELADMVSDFISPWSARGNTSHFGWCIRQHDIEAVILSLDGVLGVTQLSLLSVSGLGASRYSLTDTALARAAGAPPTDITPALPWSIAVPNRHHAIEVDGSDQQALAVRTGIGKLEIGNTFIVSPGAVDEKTE